METKDTQVFYSSLGYLFYAIAFIDSKIVSKEASKIIRCVESYWTFKNDRIDSSCIIYQTIEDLIVQQFSGEDAFSNFKNYYNTNSPLFSDKIKKHITRTVEGIALSYRGKNKYEIELLGKIEQLFNTKEV